MDIAADKSLGLPVWWDSLSPLGAAVRYVASLSPKFHWVGIYLAEGEELRLGPYLGSSTEHLQIPKGKGVCGSAWERESDLVVNDVSQTSNYLACSTTTRSEMVVLIRNPKGEIVGQFDIDSDLENAFSDSDLQSVKNVAQSLGELWNEVKETKIR